MLRSSAPTSTPARLAAACAFALLPGPAVADCLTGTGAVGMETGNQTLSVTLTNMSTNTVNLPAACGPGAMWVDPGSSQTSSGRAEFATGSGGYSILARIVSGDAVSGLAGATAAGSVRYAFRVVSQPGYTGPSPIDVEIPVSFDVSGSGQASGLTSSFSGTYTSSGSIREAGGLGTYLYQASGATAAASPTLFTPTHSVKIDTDYIVGFVVSIQAQAYSGYDSNSGTIGSAESSGQVLLSWAPQIAEGFQDPDLAVEFEMVNGALGLDPPALGSPPPLASAAAVPAIEDGPAALLTAAVAVLGAASIARSRRRSTRAT